MKTQSFDANKAVARLLKSAPVNWPDMIARMKLTPDEQGALTSQLDRHAEACAALSGYLDTGGTGARSRQRKVSRALGYSFPDRRGFRTLETA